MRASLESVHLPHTSRWREAIEAIYEFMGEKPFARDFENVEFDAAGECPRAVLPGAAIAADP
jgi:hypothetical protein